MNLAVQVMVYHLGPMVFPSQLAGNQSLGTRQELASSLGHDPAITFDTYKSHLDAAVPLRRVGFWSLQEWLQVVEKLFEKAENWKHFHGTLTGLLNQFSKYPASAAQREPAQAPESLPPRQVPRARAFRVLGEFALRTLDAARPNAALSHRSIPGGTLVRFDFRSPGERGTARAWRAIPAEDMPWNMRVARARARAVDLLHSCHVVLPRVA
eukprot:Skav221918  [mRNA]  locus=scaffold5163:59079:64427:- [translate_table: standard]